MVSTHRTKTRTPKHLIVPWNSADVIQAIALLTGGVIVGVVALSIFRHKDDNATYVIRTVTMCALFILPIIGIWLIAIRRHDAPWSSLGISKSLTAETLIKSICCLVASLVIVGTYVIIVDLFSVKFLLPEPINKTDLGTGFFQIITIALVCIIGPVTEEVFFRGFVLTGFIHHFGISRSVALSSAVFAVCHIDPGVFVPFFLTGMLLSWLYINTGSIWPSVVAHMAQNMIATTAIFTLN